MKIYFLLLLWERKSCNWEPEIRPHGQRYTSFEILLCCQNALLVKCQIQTQFYFIEQIKIVTLLSNSIICFWETNIYWRHLYEMILDWTEILTLDWYKEIVLDQNTEISLDWYKAEKHSNRLVQPWIHGNYD